ncbi:exosortase [Pseudomonas syringae]|uniref:Exosortase n=2 Tax=Pseudomonas syringae TaxID=317 RepID=A0A085VBQ0_PSESX|nr:exosortase [Pseudomonas syringae]
MSNPSNGFDRPTLQPQGHSQTLVERAGARQITLKQYQNGIVELELALPPVRRMILSGGGAKGVAYSGAVAALENEGALAGIEMLYGSSVGAIMAAMIASGMNATEFDRLCDETNLLALLQSPNDSANWLQQLFSRVGEMAPEVLPGKAGSYTQLLLSVLPLVQSGAVPLLNLVREQARAAVLARIESARADSLSPQALAIKHKLDAGGVVTFADLALLGTLIPHIKRLSVTGTAMFEGRPQLVVFNADLCPDMDIAVATHVSAALPVVFQQPGSQGLSFQEDSELTFFQDGGVLLNTPVPQLIDPGSPVDLLSGSDMLIFKFEKSDTSDKRGSWTQVITDWAVGAPVSASREYQKRLLEAFADQFVIVPLKTEKGDFTTALNGTLNFVMTVEIKNHLQARLKQTVEAHLAARAKKRQCFYFASIDDALLNLTDVMLAEVLTQGTALPVRDIQAWRMQASELLRALEEGITLANSRSGLTFDALRALIARLSELAFDDARLGWLAQALNQPEKANFQQLLQIAGREESGSVVLSAAVAEMRRRDSRVIAGNIRRTVIYPSLHLLGQTSKNIDLLLRADQLLVRAETAEQINQALDLVIEGYGSRNPILSKPWRSTTIADAKAWRVR